MKVQRSVFREYFEALLIAGIFLGFTNTFLVKTFYIPSGSMEDTLLVGDHLFVNRYAFGRTELDWESRLTPLRDVQRGDVVIFRSPVVHRVPIPFDQEDLIRPKNARVGSWTARLTETQRREARETPGDDSTARISTTCTSIADCS